MRIPRVYTDQALNRQSQLRLEGQQAHYLSKVLRLKVNAELILFNGDGFEYAARINEITKRSLDLDLYEAEAAHAESPLNTILGIGLSRAERMDLVIQKSTELGVHEITPLFTEFSEVKLQGERLEKKLRHWRQIAISACEQSGRNRPPKVHPPQTLTAWCEQLSCPLKLLLDPQAQSGLPTQQDVDQVAFLIGPEGGIAKQELDRALATGFKAVRLGPRVLRTETAPIAALTALQLRWGDFDN